MNLLQKFHKWIMSKFHIGYSQPTEKNEQPTVEQPTVEEVQSFLSAKFSKPTYNRKETIIYFSLNQLHELIDKHFLKSVNKETTKQAWRNLNYEAKKHITVNRFGYKEICTRIALVKK